LLVAEYRDAPIGIAHAYFQTRKIAWLEGVRVHPSYRGQGLAGRLNKALTRYMSREGATVARLCTGSSNLASRRHLDKTGFKLLQRFQRLKSDRLLTNPPRGIKRPRKFNSSDVLRRMDMVSAKLEGIHKVRQPKRRHLHRFSSDIIMLPLFP